MALEQGVEQACARVDGWHSQLSQNGETASLSRRVLETRHAVPLTEQAVVKTKDSVVTAELEFGVVETRVGVKDTGVLVRVTELVKSASAPSLLTGEPISRTKEGGVVRTTAFPLGRQAERTLGRLPAEVVSGIAAKVAVRRVS